MNWLGLPSAAGRLPDVIPAEPRQLLRSAYLEQVRNIAPDVLIGRDTELAEWAEFCAGPETYAWWQAGQLAGKTALASWFVTHPPAGVDIVSFFITGHGDSNAFLDAMIEQLNAINSVGGQTAPAAVLRVGVWLSLLAGAATQAEERARRLIVVVDGLDEDEAPASAPRGQPSIASLFPRRPPRGARFIITSRPDPGLPDDVPSGHPLRTCIPRRLAASRVAKDAERRREVTGAGIMTASTGNVPARIFMSYRREETAYPAAWLFDRLASHFGREQVFKDIDSIELGDDFMEVITTAVGSCDVLLALIGDRWLTITDPDGQRRLNNPGDFVRLEIEAALARNTRVIPILVAGARMPRAEELPASLAKLARRQALELTPGRFVADTRRLLRALDRAITEEK